MLVIRPRRGDDRAQVYVLLLENAAGGIKVVDGAERGFPYNNCVPGKYFKSLREGVLARTATLARK